MTSSDTLFAAGSGGAPIVPAAAGPATEPGRHSFEADRWDKDGTAPLGLAALGVNAIAQPAGRRRRPEPLTRIASLDGLRGIAALIVVVYHVFLTQPALAAPYLDPGAPVEPATWWATYTPLHLFWAGPEAVFVFFVLSGLVLALPAADRGRLNLWDYFPRRLVRLYLPVWGAVALAVGWAMIVPRAWPDGVSWWMVNNVHDPGAADVAADAVLLWSPGRANHVLWSLQWEVVYCLILPLVLIAIRRWPRMWLGAFVVIIGALLAGVLLENLALSSLPLFALGTLMAVQHRRLESWATAVESSRRAPVCWMLAFAACVGLLLSYWFLHAALPVGSGEVATVVGRVLQGLGAALVVFVIWHWPAGVRAMNVPALQWLGSRSFSLYLVHLPIVVSVTLLLAGRPALGYVLPLTLAISLSATEVFYRLVERPSHGIARRAGRAMADRRGETPLPEVVPSAAEIGRSKPRSSEPVPARAAPASVDGPTLWTTAVPDDSPTSAFAVQLDSRGGQTGERAGRPAWAPAAQVGSPAGGFGRPMIDPQPRQAHPPAQCGSLFVPMQPDQRLGDQVDPFRLAVIPHQGPRGVHPEQGS